ncbi:MAG: FtsX-like permease family protein [Nitrospinae bacterium]|nr:FtsX-like permease family protein [Nitrospinota bacterium]
MKTSQLSPGQIFALALAEFRGAGRRFLFFVICLAIGVGAVMTVKSFSTLLENAIQRESKSLLAADIALKSSWEYDPKDIEFIKKTLPPDTRYLHIKELHAMARFSSAEDPDKGFYRSLLVELKSVPTTPPFYPLYGKLKTAPSGTLPQLLGEHGALVEPNFLIKTKLKIGDTFMLGDVATKINGVIESEPDRISRAFSIGPRVLVSADTLEKANLISPGSRVKNRILIGLPEDTDLAKTAEAVRTGIADKSVNVRTYKEMQSSLTRSVENVGKFLGSVGVIALFMGGIGVAMIVRTFMTQKLDTIATMNCLGATSKTVFKVYLLQALMLGLAGSLLGVAVGYAMQFLLPAKLSDLLNLSVKPEFYWVPALQSLALGLFTTLLFTLWPLIRAVKTRPLRIFRHIADEEELGTGTRKERLIMGTVFSLGLALIIYWQAGTLKRAAVFLVALVVSILILRGLTLAILKCIRKLPPSRLMTRRYGLANLYRPNNQAGSIITTLGLGIMLVLSVRLVQMDVIDMLNKNTEMKPPNYFFIDIQKDQIEKFEQVLDKTVPEAKWEMTPLVRSRFHAIDGRTVDQWQFKNTHREEWFINREFVLTYMATPPEKNNEVIAGKWWTPEEAKIPQVSLEEDAAARLGAKIGSLLTMDIQGIKVKVPVTSIRRVNWRNVRTNFYMIFSPGGLEGAPVTFVSSVHVPEEKELALQEAVVNALPNVTALSTRDIVNTVENVVGKMLTLVDFMSAFTIIAGLFILSGAVASTKFRRLKEAAILKTLGAKRKVVASILSYEYAALGTIAGLIGVLLSMAFSWAVVEYAIEAQWHARFAPLLWTLVLAVILTLVTGILSSLDVLTKKPIQTLRKINI